MQRLPARVPLLLRFERHTVFCELASLLREPSVPVCGQSCLVGCLLLLLLRCPGLLASLQLLGCIPHTLLGLLLRLLGESVSLFGRILPSGGAGLPCSDGLLSDVGDEPVPQCVALEFAGVRNSLWELDAPVQGSRCLERYSSSGQD